VRQIIGYKNQSLRQVNQFILNIIRVNTTFGFAVDKL